MAIEQMNEIRKFVDVKIGKVEFVVVSRDEVRATMGKLAGDEKPCFSSHAFVDGRSYHVSGRLIKGAGTFQPYEMKVVTPKNDRAPEQAIIAVRKALSAAADALLESNPGLFAKADLASVDRQIKDHQDQVKLQRADIEFREKEVERLRRARADLLKEVVGV